MPNNRSVLVITVRGLGTTLIGAYGNSWVPTPSIDALAAKSIVHDHCWLDSVDEKLWYRALWSGIHSATTATLSESAATTNLPQSILAAKGRTILVTDDHDFADRISELEWDTVRTVPAIRDNVRPAGDIDDTHLSDLFSVAIEELDQLPEQGDSPTLVWIHTEGLFLPWDAPTEIRNQLADPEDPLPPAETAPPCFSVDDQTDPDLITGWKQAAGAQSVVLDECLGAIFDWLDERSDRKNWCLSLLGLDGYPMGDHGQVGPGQSALYSDRLHVPLIFYCPESLPVSLRRQELVQLPDIFATLSHWLMMPSESHTWGINLLEHHPPIPPKFWPAHFQIALTCQGNEQLLRTPAWQFRKTGSADLPELYVRPDDRYEANNIANRAGDILTMFDLLLPDIVNAFQTGARSQLPSMPEDLTQTMR